MALPKLKYPIFELTVPSTQKEYRFRPFLVAEEKILLMAKASEDPSEMFRALKQIVNNCALEEGFDVSRLAIFDLEYLFMQLRSVSVSNVVKVTYKDTDDQQNYDFEIDLKKVEVVFPEGVDKVIKISDTMGIVMKYPSASIFDDKDYLKSGDDAYYELIIRCIDVIYDGEDIYRCTDYTNEEIEKFLDDCGIEVIEKIQNFMASSPKLYHKLEYKNSNGKDRVIELQSLTDFFILG